MGGRFSTLNALVTIQLINLGLTDSQLNAAKNEGTDHEFEIPSAHIIQFVSSSNCSAYDYEFVALAQYLDVTLVTEDKKVLK